MESAPRPFLVTSSQPGFPKESQLVPGVSASLWPRAHCFMPIQSTPAVCESETYVSKEAGAEGRPLPHLARPMGFWQSPSLPPRPPTQLLSQRWIGPFRDPGPSLCSSGGISLFRPPVSTWVCSCTENISLPAPWCSVKAAFSPRCRPPLWEP